MLTIRAPKEAVQAYSATLHQLHISVNDLLRTVPTIVTAHTFCASRDTRVSYGWCLLIQGYFCAV